jgi:hypothetical protein
VANALRIRRGFRRWALLTWLLLMLCNLGVAIYERESLGAMVFTFTFLTLAAVFWIWVAHRIVR